VLVLGKSGIGKSETALDLVVRGHRLVADDVVQMWRKGGAVIATGDQLIRHHLEIRGLGIINIKDLFGVAAVRETKKLELVVELVEWDSNAEYDRLGIDEMRFAVLGVELPRLCLPVRPGRNLATLIEVAARNQLLKAQGHHSSRELQERLRAAMQTRTRSDAVE
jgi:HPr kinase/phosphorylase